MVVVIVMVAVAMMTVTARMRTVMVVTTMGARWLPVTAMMTIEMPTSSKSMPRLPVSTPNKLKMAEEKLNPMLLLRPCAQIPEAKAKGTCDRARWKRSCGRSRGYTNPEPEHATLELIMQLMAHGLGSFGEPSCRF